MKELNLPAVELRIRENKARLEIFDIIRKKFVALTPEEWVRQHFVHYLKDYLEVPASLIVIEQTLHYYRLTKRSDIVVYGPDKRPCLLVECKAPEVAVTQAVFDQAAIYNRELKVPYLSVTNGLSHFSCYLDHKKGTIIFLKEMPTYKEMITEL